MNIYKKLTRKISRKASKISRDASFHLQSVGNTDAAGQPVRTKKRTRHGIVLMGPMNDPRDKFPAPIIKSCYLLGIPLSKYAKCKKQPSEYLNTNKFDGQLQSILSALGEHVPKLEDSRIGELYTAFKDKYLSQDCLTFNNTDLAIYFTDYLLFARPRACTVNNYFDYEFYRKEIAVRDTFLKSRDLKALWDLSASKHDYFRDKALFNKTFAHLIHRDWCNCVGCSFEEFVSFAKKHEKFFAKPTLGIQGIGARIIDTKTDTLENIFAVCRQEGILAEEIVQQHEALSNINNTTLNTIRVITMLDPQGTPHIMATAGRFGRKGSVVDNFHGGGVGVVIDKNTGKVISTSIDRKHNRSIVHPDSKAVLLGLQYPEWDKVIDLAYKAALTIPEARHIGWDICITKDGNVDLIEGNDRTGYDLLQAPDQIGKKDLYAEIVSETEKELGITIFKKRKPLTIDVSQYEK